MNILLAAVDSTLLSALIQPVCAVCCITASLNKLSSSADSTFITKIKSVLVMFAKNPQTDKKNSLNKIEILGRICRELEILCPRRVNCLVYHSEALRGITQ